MPDALDDGHGGRRQPTINDVARVAGVSKGTVSHVISGRVLVAPLTRARVEETIAALRYRPAETARSLTARRRATGLEARFGASVPRLTTVGYVSVDFTACLDRLPEREERRLAGAILKSIGGPAANVAAVAAGVGAPFPVAASLLTSIGVDQDSDWAASELARRNVDIITPKARRSGRLNRALVLVEADGRRTIINEPSDLGEVDIQRFVADTDPASMNWWLHFEGYHVPAKLVTVGHARAKGFKASMQVTGLPVDFMRRQADEIFGNFDLVFLHRETLSVLAGAPCDLAAGLRSLVERTRAAAIWPELVVVTLGAAGAVAVMASGEIIEVSALPVDVVDTTGAGDSFVGGFLAGWLHGAPVRQSLLMGCAAGSLQVTSFGAQERRPSASELLSLIAEAQLPIPATA